MTRQIVLALSAAALLAPAPASAATRSCPQSDPDNGLSGLRAAGISCPGAFAVAKRTNSVKCFLNGNTCIHTFRGRRWKCTLRRSSRVTCTSGSRVVKYRLG